MSLLDKIPNNVNLGADKRLQRALETWQPDFQAWWREMGPSGFQEDQVFLRTAISVEPDGWANYGFVRMPEYRWGIFLTPPEENRSIGFGDEMGKPVWNDVPGELRNMLRRIIVTQADTEPASVEQQRELGKTAPSLYDLRNLFQVNVEEGRHLWAMVHLLHQYFGRDGREEAEQLLQRRSGNPDTPRILNTFNETTDEWLSFFCFAMFTDRDGKYQLASLAESGFDPLSRCTRFMLTEEAFHLFVGETGLDRIIKRSAELTSQDPNGDARKLGGIDLPTIQKWINFWFSSAVELFGGEISNNAADFFSTGLKGRYKEKEKYEDHRALEGVYAMDVFENGSIVRKEVSLRNAMNEVLRDEYVADCERAMRKWNHRLLRTAGDALAPQPEVQSLDGHVRRVLLRPRWHPHLQGRVRGPSRRVAPHPRRSCVREEPDEAGPRAGQDGELDRASAEGRGRQPRRVRVRARRGRGPRPRGPGLRDVRRHRCRP
jgi:benzoyl-CoA 2,3-epoxidase subunit B